MKLSRLWKNHTCGTITLVELSHLWNNHTCRTITSVEHHTCETITPVELSHLWNITPVEHHTLWRPHWLWVDGARVPANCQNCPPVLLNSASEMDVPPGPALYHLSSTVFFRQTRLISWFRSITGSSTRSASEFSYTLQFPVYLHLT